MTFKHLKETEHSYFQHFKTSVEWSLIMLRLSCCAFLHAFYPDIYTDTVTKNIEKYAKKIKNSKKSKDDAPVS
jgi:hypothetical protein